MLGCYFGYHFSKGFVGYENSLKNCEDWNLYNWYGKI